MVSILILTLNEQDNLPGCLDSVAWSDDIHVFDSFSTDRTPQIALERGVHLTQHAFTNWAEHQNWGLANIPFKHPWVFYIDADERMSPTLRDNILTLIQQQTVTGMPEVSSPAVSYKVQRRDFFMGQWLRHVQASSFYQRLFRPECMRYERLVNPISIASGPVGTVAGFLDHYPFTKGVTHWIERHNKYSTLEAAQTVANRRAQKTFSIRSAFFEKDFHERRYHQKELMYRLPLRPLVKFSILYILKRGFLDGPQGLTYCILQSIYEYLIVLKTRELESGIKEIPS